MTTRKKLAGSVYYIKEDFSRLVREKRRALAPRLKEAREGGLRAKMVYDHLIVEGKKVFVDEKSGSAEAHPKTRTRDNTERSQDWRVQGRRGKIRPLTDSASPATPTKRFAEFEYRN